MKKLISLAALSVNLWAAAVVNPAEYQTLDFNTDYEVRQYQEFKGKIVAPETGIIIEYGNIPAHVLTSAGELQMVGDWNYAGYINGKQAYQFAAKAGTTYYIYSDFPMNGGTISFAMNPAVKVIGVSPEEGSVYDIASTEYVDVAVNQNITIGKATVSVGELTAEAQVRTYGSVSSILINEALLAWYTAGSLNEGDAITVVLSEIVDNMGRATKDITLNYVAGGKPYTLIGTELPDPILSWYPAGSKDAVAKFIFSGPVGPDPRIELGYSPIELGYEYTEKLPATVDGDTIIVDLSGKLRSPEQMSASGADYDFIDIRLYGIKDARGQYILASEGSIGSFHIRTPFKTLDRINFAAEFTPAYGSDLANETEIKIAYNNPSDLDFSAVVFTSGNETVSVDKSELKVADGLITAAIPEGWNHKQNVYVSLAGLTAADGYDHSAEFTAKYNGFAVLFSNPAAGATLSALTKGRTITIDTNLEAGETVTFTLMNGSKIAYGPVTMTEKYEGQFIHAMETEVILYAADNYTMVFSAKGTNETIAIKGQSIPFEYSDLELESISPEQGSALKGGDEIMVIFTGLVAIEQLAGSVDFAAQSQNNNGDYDFSWIITLPDELPAGDFSIIFTASDENGHIVKGNSGSNESSCFVVNYKSTSGIIDIQARPEAAVIYDINGRRLTAPTKGINIINGRKVLY